MPAYLYAIAGISKDKIISNINYTMMRNVLSLSIVAVLVIALAFFFGHFTFILPINRLVNAAQKFGDGDIKTRTGLPHSQNELGRLAKSFDDMASLLEDRDTKRSRAEELLKHSNDRISRLNDVLHSIRDIGILINSVKDPLQLLNAVCDSLVKTRGYIVVWVGKPEADSKRVSMVAHSGRDANFLQHAPITWDDGPLGQGPTGIAMREHRAVIFDDIAVDPRFAPWRDPVMAHGGASIASVPIMYQESLFGVLTVKADHPNAFDQEEIELLGDLTADLARALHGRENEEGRALAEEALRKSEEKYRMIADFTYDWEYWMGPEGRYLYVSPSCERITGYRAEAFMEDSDLLERIVHPEDRHHMAAHMKQSLSNDLEESIDFRIITRDGEERWIGHRCRAVHDHEGHRLGRRGSNRDISKRKRAEAERVRLEIENRQLQKTESLGRMAAAIAHLFNNQLLVVMGNLELALYDLARGEDPSEILTAAMQGGRKAAEVSGLMLTYVGHAQGKHELLDLSEACRRALPNLQTAVPKEVVFDVELPSPGPTVSADAGQLQQVLRNLVDNAGEACGKGGGVVHVTITTVSPSDIPLERRFPVGWQPRHVAYACLEVADNGYGIDAENIEKLFDPFYSSKFTGRGLGLAVVQGIVRAHGGGIVVKSEPGQGSVFRAFFPVSAEQPSAC